MSVPLNLRRVGEGRPLVIVHGLFGSGDNWQTLAGKFPGWQVQLPDLRNHGDSPWAEGFRIGDLAGDLAALARRQGWDKAVWMGHSLGGKTVLELALSEPDLVRAVAALDMVPLPGPARYRPYFEALRALDLAAVTSRGDAQSRLEAAIPERATLQFLLKSLVPDPAHPGRWRWRLNLEALDRDYDDVWRGLEGGRSWDGPAYFLYGGASDYVRPGDAERVRTWFPRARFDEVPGAGHWLHAEQPALVLARLNAWLDSLP